MFIAEIQWDIPMKRVYVPDQTIARFQALHFADMAPEIKKMETDFVDRLLERFVMNVTALNNYLKCPLEFYFVNLVKIPRPKNEAIEFGSAVHYALEQLFRGMIDSGPHGNHRPKPFPRRFEPAPAGYRER